MSYQSISTLLLFLLVTTGANATEITRIGADELSKLTPLQRLGQQIYFDSNLSNPAGQACASCHDPKTAFTDPELLAPVSSGAVEGRSGTRNSPTVMYAAFSPYFHFDSEEGVYIGGQFLDGRAETLNEQAKQPFLNVNEMNNADAAEVVGKVRGADYAALFRQVYGQTALDDTEQAFQQIADALAAFENTPILNRFTSKYDYYLAGEVQLSEQEQRGLDLFNDENKANCAACHPSTAGGNTPPLFTDFTYDNLGVPSNPDILALQGDSFVDLGLGVTVNDANENGKFKVPTLRNIAKTAPYMHNGVFASLRDVVDFYNTRDTDSRWGAPEVAENVNADELGNLQLTDQEVDDIVAFLRTLSDGYQLGESAMYAGRNQQIALPQIRLEAPSSPSSVGSAVLRQTGGGSNRYRLVSWQASQDGNSSGYAIPRYSMADELLEIPLLSIDGVDDYIAQFRRVSGEPGYVFELLYSKPLQ